MGGTLNSRLLAALTALGLLVAFAAPVAAAPASGGGATTSNAQLANGTICGAVTAYTPPTPLTADGSITIGGVSDPVDMAATISAQAAAALAGTLPLTTCLTLTVSNPGTSTAEVTGIAIAASGQLCGPVTAAGTGAARVFSIGGAVLPAATTAGAELTALLNAAVTANASVCVDVTVDANTGAVTAVANLDATFTLCGQVVGSGSGSTRTFTVAGLAIPASQLSASEAAALELAITNTANACVDLVVVDTQITSATARVDVCVTVGAVTATSVTLDGVAIPLTTGSTVSSEVRQGATLAVRVAINATTGAVTISPVILAGCTVTGVAGGGARLTDTAVDVPSTADTALVGLGVLALAGAAFVARRREDIAA